MNEHQALRREQEQIQKLLIAAEQTANVVFITDAAGTITYANPAFENTYGYAREEALGSTPAMLKSGRHDREFYERLWRRLLAGECVREEFVNKRRDGGLVTMEASISPAIDERGERIGFIAVQQDVTDRKRAEEALRQSEDRFRRSFAASPVPMSLSEMSTGRILDANTCLLNLLGYAREELIGRSSIELGIWADPAEREKITQTVETDPVREREVRLRRKSGEILYVLDSVQLLEFGEERVLLSVFQDVTARKQTQEALRNSERRFSLAFQSSPVPTAISRIDDGQFIDVNEQFVRALGYSREELLTRSSLELGIWVDPGVRDSLAKKLGSGSVVRDAEVQLRKKSGEILEAIGSVARVEVGSLACALSTFVDITDRKRAEQESRRSEERFRRLFESNTIGIVIADVDGRTLEANDVYLDLLGYTRGELEAGAILWDKITPPEYLQRDAAAVEQLRASGSASPWMKELIRKDGSRVPIMIGVAMLRESEGSCIAYILDLSERRRSEAALRSSEERYRILFENNPQAMWVYDRETLRFLAVNEAACRSYGYTQDELLRLSIVEIRPLEERERLIQQLEAYAGDVAVCRTSRHRTKSGELREVEIASHPVRFGDREAQLVLATDVTDRRNLEEQFRQAQKMEAVGLLAGGVAHDFNNLLTAVLGYSDLLSGKLEPDSEAAEDLGEIRKAGERAASLTRQLLAFGRQQVLDPKVLNLNSLVREVEKMLRRVIGEDVSLTSVLDPGLKNVRADAGQLTQVLLNLAVNARDAMPRGGKLTIETANVEFDDGAARQHASMSPGPYVMLAITDTGIGMDSATRARIFEPFFTTKEKGRGTGLGLSTVYGIVKQSGGYIWAHSEPGKGTTFNVYLPPVAADADSSDRMALTLSRLRGAEKILLVEDEETVRTLCRTILESYGYSVMNASGAEEALELVRRSEARIDLVLTDVVMPEMGGAEFVSRLRVLRPEVKVLYMSGYTDDTVVRHGLLEKSSAFLQKPFTAESLARKLKECLA